MICPIKQVESCHPYGVYVPYWRNYYNNINPSGFPKPEKNLGKAQLFSRRACPAVLGGRQPWGGCIFGCFALSPESGIIYQHRVKPGGFSGWFYTVRRGGAQDGIWVDQQIQQPEATNIAERSWKLRSNKTLRPNGGYKNVMLNGQDKNSRFSVIGNSNIYFIPC